jgi:hypothetical protein
VGDTYFVASDLLSNEVQGLQKSDTKFLALGFFLDRDVFDVTLGPEQIQAKKGRLAKMV